MRICILETDFYRLLFFTGQLSKLSGCYRCLMIYIFVEFIMINRKLITRVVFIGFVFMAAFFCQAAEIYPNLQKNELSIIKNTADLKCFISKFGKIFSDFIPGLDSLTAKTNFRRILLPGKYRMWYIDDFDNNGWPDLLVTGTLGSKKIVLCFTDSGYNNFTVKQLVLNTENMPATAATFTKSKKHGYITAWGETQDSISRIVRAELKVIQGNLIENTVPTKKLIFESLECRFTGCHGRCPMFALKIDSRGNAELHAEKFNPMQGEFSTILRPDDFSELKSLLSEVNFVSLKDNYKVTYTDAPSASVTLVYNGGKTKQIADYGQRGTLGLKALYNAILRLRESQTWVPLKR
ncbi:MAG: DUF6438 domain-containing protein [Ignavibacteria bacterium]|nr:DUF6438 domain-containing protein [Ignavibacteria bacterium]